MITAGPSSVGGPAVRDHRDVVIRPVVSEKSYGLMADNVYTSVVAPDSTKPEIRDAVESIFDVTVVKVNTLHRKPKRRRDRRTNRWGRRPGQKRALVTLSEGDSIDLFEI